VKDRTVASACLVGILRPVLGKPLRAALGVETAFQRLNFCPVPLKAAASPCVNRQRLQVRQGLGLAGLRGPLRVLVANRDGPESRCMHRAIVAERVNLDAFDGHRLAVHGA